MRMRPNIRRTLPGIAATARPHDPTNRMPSANVAPVPRARSPITLTPVSVSSREVRPAWEGGTGGTGVAWEAMALRYYIAPPMSPSSNNSSTVLDARALSRTLRRMAEEIVELNNGTDGLVLVGIQRRAVQLEADEHQPVGSVVE